jgi:hypothetical protein
MSQPASPFNPGRPLRADQPIFGRDEVFQYIHGQLARFGSVNLVGERRMGKTSLLHHLLGNPRHRPPSGDPPLLLAEVDFQRQVTDSTGFYGLALREILRNLPDHPDFADAPARFAELETRAAADFAEFDRWLRRLRDARLARPVLLVDEFERLLEPEFRPGFPLPLFYEGLRSLLTADLLALVVASRLPLAEHFARHPEAMTSTFPTYLAPYTLAELDEAAAEQVLMQGMVFGLTLSEIQQARRWAGGHPCRLQCAGDAWFWAKQGKRDAVWAERRFRELAGQTCLARAEPAPVGLRVRRGVGWLTRVPHILLVDVPRKTGGAIQGLGEKLDQLAAWVLGFGFIVAAVGALGHWLDIAWVQALIDKVKGWFS